MNYKGGITLRKYYCKDCGKEICLMNGLYGRGRCKSCSRKGILNPLFGKKRPDASKKFRENNPMKNSKIKKKIIITMKDGRRKGKNHPLYGKKRPEQSLRMKGKNNPIFTRPSYGNGAYYRKIYMRSSWEIAYAKWLDKNGIEWQYESDTFDLGNTTYTPDFYLPKDNKYIEIKGYWREDAKEKFKLFKKIYSNIKINVLDQKQFEKEGVLI